MTDHVPELLTGRGPGLPLGTMGILGRSGRLLALVRLESVGILAAYAGLAWLLPR